MNQKKKKKKWGLIFRLFIDMRMEMEMYSGG
jgi:hypothetical protein